MGAIEQEENAQSTPDGTAAPRELTGEEAALYDRQIRLWGLEAQRKLASSSVLITGDLSGFVTQELAKNIVLAGIARLRFEPRPNSAASDTETRGFLGASMKDVIDSLRDMNPHVDVALVDKPVNLSQFSVVCAVGMHRHRQLEIADACRAANVPLLLGRVSGPAGWVFLDLGKRYEFQDKTAGPENIEETAMMTTSYCSFRDALDAPWRTESPRSEYGWHFVNVLQEFDENNKRLPGLEIEDSDALLGIYDRLRKEKKYAPSPREKLDSVKERLAGVWKAAHIDLPPVAAIVGGIWGREVIKVVSGKDEPLNNFFFFSALTSAGSVERVGTLEQ